MALKMKEAVKGFDQKKVNDIIEQLEKSTRFAMNSLKNVPGLVVVSENDLSKIFLELREKANKIKTEEDKKKFFEQYSLVAGMCQSYIEAANDWQSIKEAGLKAISFYFGVDEKSAESPSSAIFASSFIVLGVGPFKKIKDIKKISNAEKLKQLEKTAPNTAKALKKVSEKISQYEEEINKIVAKEKEFLKSLARLSSKSSEIGLRRLEEVRSYFRSPGVVTYLKNCKDPNARKQFIIENIIDKSSLVIKNTDPLEIKRKKELISKLLVQHSRNYDEIIKNYIAAGGTEKEAAEIIGEINLRVRAAGDGISVLWLKDLKNEVYHEIAHDYKNIIAYLETFKDMLFLEMKK